MAYTLPTLRAMLISLRERGKKFEAYWLELATEKFATGVLHEGDHAIDAGAHRGRHTLPMARAVGPTGRVYAIEAAQETLVKLKATIAHAEPPFVRDTIIVHDIAVSDINGRTEFIYAPTATGLSGLRTTADKGTVREEDLVKQEADVARLDDLIPDDPKIRFIKLDIEGAELPALRGAPKLLARCRPCLAFEHGAARYQKRFNYTAEDFFSFFDANGYTIYTPLSSVFDRTWQDGPQPWQLFAAPREKPELVAGALGPALIDALQAALTKPLE